MSLDNLRDGLTSKGRASPIKATKNPEQEILTPISRLSPMNWDPQELKLEENQL
jgi:hypothetical protein